MSFVHDDGTVHVEVRLPQALAEEDTISHVFDEGRLKGRERLVKLVMLVKLVKLVKLVILVP